MVLVVLIQAIVMRVRLKLSLQEQRHADKRIKLVTDMIAGIRTIKSYAWEHAYAEKVDRERKQQLRIAYRSNCTFLFTLSFFMGSSGAVLLLIYIGVLFSQQGDRSD